VVKQKMLARTKRHRISERDFEEALGSLQREAAWLPLESRRAAGLKIVELGTLGYEFTHLLDSENAGAIEAGLQLYAEASCELGCEEEAIAALRELEATDNYGLDAKEAIALLARSR
jgi:hypothetical protein